MIKCRERAPQIEAYHHDLGHELPEWLLTALCANKARLEPDSSLVIQTRFGAMHAAVGDWILLDAATGDLKTMEADAFARKYEPVILDA